MIRRPSALVWLVATLAILVASCGGGTAGPALTDPTEIITAALKSTDAAKTVHIDVTIDGKVALGLPFGGASGPTDLTGVTASVDIDRAANAAHAMFAAPNLLNLSGEVIAVDGKAYVKTTLTGARYRVTDAKGGLLVDLTDTGGMIDNLGDFLLKPGVDPVKGDDVACGSKQCYTVNVDLASDELAALLGAGAAGLPVDLAGARLQLTILVEKDLPYHLAGVSAKVTIADSNTVSLEMTMSKWDQPVSIVAPPADQVAPGS